MCGMKSMSAHFPQLFSTTAHKPSQCERQHETSLLPFPCAIGLHFTLLLCKLASNSHFFIHWHFCTISAPAPRPSRMMVVYEPSSKAQELAGTFTRGISFLTWFPHPLRRHEEEPRRSLVLLFHVFLWAVAYCQQFFKAPVTGSHLVTIRYHQLRRRGGS